MSMNPSAYVQVRNSQFPLIVILAFAVIAPLTVSAQSKRKVFVSGQRAFIFDERLSVLRVQPDVKSPLKQRLRRGRRVGILGAARNRDGVRFLRVAVSRNTSGWVLADAVLRPGGAADAEKLMKLIGETRDDFTRARLARLCADEFRSTKFAPKALMILGEAAEGAAERLSRDARRRVGTDEPDSGLNSGLSRRDFMLNYVGLDRYNRIGVTFDYDAASDRIVYDGAAYRELARRYPRSDEAQDARIRLAPLGNRIMK